MDAEQELDQLVRERRRDRQRGRFQPREHGVIASIDPAIEREDDRQRWAYV